MFIHVDVDMNFLLFQALNTISTLPFHFVQDTWRWKLFAGNAPVDKLNDDYWADKYKTLYSKLTFNELCNIIIFIYLNKDASCWSDASSGT